MNKEEIEDSEEISKIELGALKKIKDKLFSDEKLTKGEIIQIIVTIILILVILFTYYATKCSLDCSMCSNVGQTLVQSGLG